MKRKFCWLPTYCADQYHTVWLEYVFIAGDGTLYLGVIACVQHDSYLEAQKYLDETLMMTPEQRKSATDRREAALKELQGIYPNE